MNVHPFLPTKKTPYVRRFSFGTLGESVPNIL